MNKVKFAIPVGSLEKATFQLLENSGYRLSGQERTYRPVINDPRIELKLLRPQEIPVSIQEGLQDLGITGRDWIRETRADVEILQDLDYGRIRIVTAIPRSWNKVSSFSDVMTRLLDQEKIVRIATEYLNITAEYVKSSKSYRKLFGNSDPIVVTPWWRKGENTKVGIFLSFGATEAKPPEDADLIVDVIDTGTTLERNNLKVIETIMESSAVLIANKRSLDSPEKREKILDIMFLLKGVVDGRKRVHIFVNVRKENLKTLLTQLPALKRPTISPLSDKNWYSINTVIEKESFLDLLPRIRKLAQGLVVYEPRQVLALDRGSRTEKHG